MKRARPTVCRYCHRGSGVGPLERSGKECPDCGEPLYEHRECRIRAARNDRRRERNARNGGSGRERLRSYVRRVARSAVGALVALVAVGALACERVVVSPSAKQPCPDGGSVQVEPDRVKMMRGSPDTTLAAAVDEVPRARATWTVEDSAVVKIRRTGEGIDAMRGRIEGADSVVVETPKDGRAGRTAVALDVEGQRGCGGADTARIRITDPE